MIILCAKMKATAQLLQYISFSCRCSTTDVQPSACWSARGTRTVPPSQTTTRDASSWYASSDSIDCVLSCSLPSSSYPCFCPSLAPALPYLDLSCGGHRSYASSGNASTNDGTWDATAGNASSWNATARNASQGTTHASTWDERYMGVVK